MLPAAPNFSPYPFERLRRTSRRAAAIESVIARWIRARPLGARVAQLVGGPVAVRVRAVHEPAPTRHVIDPDAARAEVRIGGVPFVLTASSRPIRALTQRLLGGPDELAAPRPLTTTEHAIWALAIAAAIEDTGVAAEVWPLVDAPPAHAIAIELELELATTPAATTMTVIALCPSEVTVRAAPGRAVPGWAFDVPVVVAACTLPRETLTRLAVRDVVTVEPGLALVVGEGTIVLSAPPGAVEAEVVTGYVPRDMALADEAHLELTVQLGTTRLTLRQLAELAPGQIVALGRPLAGPFEVRAAGQLVATGELVDVDGELGVRIVSLQE